MKVLVVNKIFSILKKISFVKFSEKLRFLKHFYLNVENLRLFKTFLCTIFKISRFKKMSLDFSIFYILHLPFSTVFKKITFFETLLITILKTENILNKTLSKIQNVKFGNFLLYNFYNFHLIGKTDSTFLKIFVFYKIC